MKRLLSVLLAILLIVPTFTAVAFAEEAKTISFSDVDSTTTQGQAIIKLATAGVLLGYPDGTFKPNQPITRGELSKVINKIFNYTEADTEMFPDVVKDKDWYYNDVAIAKKAGYIKGYDDGTFRGENNMTREEACTILTRVGGMYDLGLTYPVKDAISEWAVPYVNMVITGGFMAVEPGDVFRATEKITRGEFCEAFSKFVQIKEITPPADDKKEEDKKEEDKKEDTTKPGTNTNPGTSIGGNNNGLPDDTKEPEPPEEEDPPVDDEPIDYVELNSETVEQLNTALDELKNYYCVEDFEEKLINICIACIEKVLPYADKEELTNDFVESACKAEIKEATAVWKGLDADQKVWLYDCIKDENNFNKTTVEWLSTFFGVPISLD